MLIKCKKKYELIVFTRIPEPLKTKTRMMPYLSPDECKELHISVLMDLNKNLKKRVYDIIVYYDGENDIKDLKNIFGENILYKKQYGNNIGEKMQNAINNELNAGYKNVVLVGSDIPDIDESIIKKSFNALNKKDVVIGETYDGGYYLIGMSKNIDCIFSGMQYGISSVYENTIKNIENNGYTVCTIDKKIDLDDRTDLLNYYTDFLLNNRNYKKSHIIKFINKVLKISIIIPVLNEEKNIDTFIKQLKKVNSNIEIIFVDGGSADTTVNHICKIYKVMKSEKGRGIQLNKGAEIASGDILFFLHSDSELPIDIESQIRKVILKTPIGCFGINYHSNNFFMWTCKHISNLRAKYRKIVYGDQGMFILRKMFFQMGKFKEIPIMEDYDFSLRLKKMNIQIGLTNDRILTSNRRYPKGTIGKLKFMYLMHSLRKMYRAGVDVEYINNLYNGNKVNL